MNELKQFKDRKLADWDLLRYKFIYQHEADLAKQFISDLIDEIEKAIPEKRGCLHLIDTITGRCLRCGKTNAKYLDECELNDGAKGSNQCREEFLTNLNS
jgi:hypothetical protein